MSVSLTPGEGTVPDTGQWTGILLQAPGSPRPCPEMAQQEGLG